MYEFLMQMGEKYPVIFAIVSYMGMARLIMKPLMSFLHEYVLITPSEKDNILLKKVEESKVFKAIVWFLDYFASLKIVKK